MEYRITFSPNNLEPFTWLCESFDKASILANYLCEFDLGRKPHQSDEYAIVGRMIAAYKAYRRKHSINHPDLIFISTCTIDKKIGDYWWIVSEDLEEEDMEPCMKAFDNDFVDDYLDDMLSA